jgi:DNA polymerase-3 subunit epsilon
MNDRILFIDTETGGIDPHKHSLLSIGLVVWCDFKIIDSRELLINDGILNVTPKALEINKINLEEHRKNSISPKKAGQEILLFLKKNFEAQQKVTLAGHNVNFDVNFFRVFLAKNNIDFNNYFSHRFVDTSSILYYLYLAGKIKSKAISSQEAFDLFGIQVADRHTAVGDAMATAKLFTALLLLLRKRFKGDLQDELELKQMDLFPRTNK